MNLGPISGLSANGNGFELCSSVLTGGEGMGGAKFMDEAGTDSGGGAVAGIDAFGLGATAGDIDRGV